MENEQIAHRIVKRYMVWAAGAALVPLPIVDMIAIAGVELKMLAEISKVYQIPFEKSRVQAVVGSLIGYVLPHAFSVGLIGGILKTIPGVGFLVGVPSFAIFAAAYTWALGRVFITHFESGGTFLNFDAEAVKEHFRAHFADGQKMAATMHATPKAEV